jgi:hypothetical protein
MAMPSAWGRLWVDMKGQCSAQIYYDGVLAGSPTLTASTRQLVTRGMPLGLAQRVSVRLVGTGGTVQDEIYSITIEGEAQGG